MTPYVNNNCELHEKEREDRSETQHGETPLPAESRTDTAYVHTVNNAKYTMNSQRTVRMYLFDAIRSASLEASQAFGFQDPSP